VSGAEREIEVGGRRIRVTSLDRVLWPETGFTKAHLIDYYRSVAPAILPHLEGRPLTLGRFPDGIDGRGFAQMECRGAPEWMATQPLRLRTGELRRYCVIRDEASLVWVANLSTVELHTYQFTGARPDEPVALALDLDPGPGRGLADACSAALLVRDALDELGLTGWPKTSGASGVHVFVPFGEAQPRERTRSLARRLAAELAEREPGLVTDDQRPAARRGVVLVDWLQAEPRRSIAAPYSLRATSRPQVSMPLGWEEVEQAAGEGDAPALRFGPDDALARIERDGDLWGAVPAFRQQPPLG
jgi:bifunctional non-homologous end joining protein LigD